MKKVFALILTLALALSLVACGGNSKAVDIAVLVPNTDHGWTGAVMSYAEEYAAELNEAGKYSVKVITSTDAANQISQIEDLIENKTAKNVVILPQDNTVEASMKKLAESGIPFVMFDRIIDSVSGSAIASVKGDNNGIGAETAKRFIANGMKPGDKILIIPGDNSSVPGMRNDGFKGVLLENGWTQEQVDAIESTDYTGWSRAKGKELFTAWLDAHTVEEITACKWIFTHDDEIATGMLEALKSSEIDAEKKAAFYAADPHIGTSAVLFALLLFLPCPPAVITALVFVIGLLQGASVPSLVILCSDAFPGRSASASSVIVLSVSLAALIAPSVMGTIIRDGHHLGAMVLILGCLVLSILPLLFATRRKRG